MGSIGPSSEKIVYFHYTKHAVARWPQHLSLVLLLLSDTCFKKESDLWRVCISDGWLECVQADEEVRLWLQQTTTFGECHWSKTLWAQWHPKWYKDRVVVLQHQELALATYHSNRWKFLDDVKRNIRSHDTSQCKKLMMMGATMLHPAKCHRYSTGYNRLHYSNVLLCSIR